MKKLMLSSVILSAALIASPGLSQVAEKPTVGDCISDGFLGNEPNIEGPFAPGGPSEQEPGTKAGRVVPSQSPGPFVNSGPNPPPRNDRVRGSSPGDVNQTFGGGALQEFCRTATQTPRSVLDNGKR